MANASGGYLKANQSQGNVKDYAPPHARLSLTDAGREHFSQLLQDIQDAGGPGVIYSDPKIQSNYIRSIKGVTGDLVTGSLMGVAGKYSTGGFPALETSFTDSSGTTHKIPVVITWASKRTASGAAYQNATEGLVNIHLRNENYTDILTTTAEKGSQVADVEVSATSPTGQRVNFNIEVKGPGGKYFDKTVKRGSSTGTAAEKLIDDIASALATPQGLSASNLEEYIDGLRNKDPANQSSVGYIGDPGIQQRSGALPTKYFSLPPTQKIIDAIKKHWKNGEDTYFAVSDGSKAWLWYTGHGPNVLGAEPFTSASVSGNISLSTYGTAGPGRLRVALKSKFNLGTATVLS